MTVTSPFFLVGLLVFASLAFTLPPGRPRQALFAFCNLAFLAFFVPNLASAIALAAFVLSGYAAAWKARRLAGSRGYTPFVACYLGLLLAAFLVLKKYHFLYLILPRRILDQAVAVAGLSYMLFRQIHFVIDSAEGQIESPSLWEYLNYQLNLFGLLAGPIQRFQEFRESWVSLRPLTVDWLELVKINARLMMGIVKVQVVGARLLQWTVMATATQLHISRPSELGKFAVLFYAYPAYIYFNFSGYCDIVIAGAALVGMRLPENFDRPYLARNVIDYWTRWHITLTNWIRDYVFTPMYKGGAERWPGRGGMISYFCFFAALLLAGIWHGSSWNFVVFGLIHGTGVAVTKMWEARIIRQHGRKGLREYLKSRPTRVMASLLTLHFVCFAFLFFPPGLSSRVDFLLRFVSERPDVALAEVRGK